MPVTVDGRTCEPTTDLETGRLAVAAGFRGEALTTAIAISYAECPSRLNCDLGDLALQNDKWGPSVGLWQIRSLKADKGTGRTRDELALLDPAFNAKAAFVISGGGTNFKPWTTYVAGRHLPFRNRALKAAALDAYVDAAPLVEEFEKTARSVPGYEAAEAAVGVYDTVKDATVGVLSLVRDVITALGRRETWERVLFVVGGLIAMTAGAVLLSRDLIGEAVGGVVAPVAAAAAG